LDNVHNLFDRNDNDTFDIATEFERGNGQDTAGEDRGKELKHCLLLSLKFHFESSIGHQLIAVELWILYALEGGESNQLHLLYAPFAKIMDCKA
jgi:hypothetical protein